MHQGHAAALLEWQEAICSKQGIVVDVVRFIV